MSGSSGWSDPVASVARKAHLGQTAQAPHDDADHPTRVSLLPALAETYDTWMAEDVNAT